MKNLIVTRKIIIKSIRCIEFKGKNQYYELRIDYFDYEKLISILILRNFKSDEEEKICVDCMLDEIMLVEEFEKQFIEKSA